MALHAPDRIPLIAVARFARTAACLGLTALLLAGCSGPDGAEVGEVEAQLFDPLEMTWSPHSLANAAPCLVGWRSEGASGALVTLSGPTPAEVLWRTPAQAGPLYMRLIAVDPAGSCMAGEVYSDEWGAEPAQRVLLFEPDGSVRDLPRPDGYEGVSDVVFCDAGALAIAYHATLDEFQTTLGLVAPGGQWRQLTLEGDVPPHQFIESLSARPGSDLVGLVLKTAGDVDDRDEGLLVLARLEDSKLTVVTPPFCDDSLPGAQPLLDADGVVYARLWSTKEGVSAPTLMRVEWNGAEWVETEILAPGAVAAGPETGQAVAQGLDGGYWIRDAKGDAHGEGSTLLHLAPGAIAPEPAGVDISGVDWFSWVEGPTD